MEFCTLPMLNYINTFEYFFINSHLKHSSYIKLYFSVVFLIRPSKSISKLIFLQTGSEGNGKEMEGEFSSQILMKLLNDALSCTMTF